MHKFFETIARKRAGALIPVPGATLTVYETGTTNLATLYADNEIDTITNPVAADSAGLVQCKMNTGKYDLVFSDGVSSVPVSGYVAIGGVEL